ncbi:uncharacterized protein LTHEOB_7072 [Lasiodiplodia theobromae]|uniref:uncharacterized protein n=1 Tax=Lasiodiplodia theobromae TaxID=45133 RepID=UPI0015C2EAFD|nr:uncharacterized protein LTHEOB_7072 [Lasiodiplodia theobromae]KAF4542818.1 hypothetical protein LTHEOB_7072 [Lasiodiplodia theobromae]
MGVKEEGIVEKINEELQEEVDWSPVLTRWMGKAQKEQHHSAEDDAQSEAFSGSTLVDEWQSEVAGMADFNEEQQEEVDWSQVLTSMGEAEKEQNHSTEDDTQSQWPSESILIDSLENETEPYEAASVAELYEAASVAAPGPYQAAREEYVFLIKDEKRLKILRDDIEKLLRPEIFEESFRNMLVVFATQLRAEARHSEEKDAARTVRINSIYIANCITEGIFKMVEFQRLPGRRNVLESYLLKYGQKAGVGNGVQIFERGEDDELDQFEENEPEGPINLLKMEAFIKSSRAWSKLFDNLESWIRDTEKAKGLWRKKQKIDSNNQNPPEQDAQSQQTSSDDTSSLTSSFKRTSFMHWSSYSIGSSTTRIENSPEVCSTVATLQVALLWAWAIVS